MSGRRAGATFGELLREHRLAAGLTQEALAEQAGVSTRTIQEIEADAVHPRRATAFSLVEALSLPDAVRDLLMGAAAPRPRPRPRLAAAAGGGPEWASGPDVSLLPEPLPESRVREPALMALPRPARTNVPWPVSSLLGREADLAAIRDLFVEQRQRLVTLLGVGGAGKTRLAIQVARELLDTFEDGVWLVELAPVAGPALVSRVVAGALGVREVQDAPIVETLLASLRRKRALLVLDNCEHLIGACAELVEQLLRACPDLHILATSREPLRIDGERRWQVRPLAIPQRTGPMSFGTLASLAAVRLFAERAQAIDADFTLTAANVSSVGQICALLDGIPLAIELAASQVSVLTVDQIAERLEGGLRVLAGGRRTAPHRQQTMEAALDWSHDLLAEAERATFRTLSTFAGSFDLDAVEAVCDGGAREDGRGTREDLSSSPLGPRDSLVTLLSRLIDTSLVVAEPATAGRRFRLLEPVRQYAQRLLLASGEADGARASHAAYYAALAERAAPKLHGPEQVAWLNRLEEERDNLRAALHWIAEHGEVSAFCRLAAALELFWEARGYLSEGRRWLDAAVAACHDNATAPAIRLQTLMAAGALAHWQGDLPSAEAQLTVALALARDLADRHTEAEVLGRLSMLYLRREAVEHGLRLSEESLRLSHELADERLIAYALFNVGVAWLYLDEPSRAMTLLEECVRRYRQLGDVRYAAVASTMLGRGMLDAGEHDRAAPFLREGLIGLKAVGDLGFIVVVLMGLAHVSRAQGEPRRAAQFAGAAEALRAALATSPPARARAGEQALLASLHEQLTASEFDEAFAAGETMSLDQALAEISNLS